MLTVGHNDPGYLPDAEPLTVASLDEAIEVLCNEVRSWFSVELDGEDAEVTEYDIRDFCQKVKRLQQRSTLILRGHAFWIQ